MACPLQSEKHVAVPVCTREQQQRPASLEHWTSAAHTCARLSLFFLFSFSHARSHAGVGVLHFISTCRRASHSQEVCHVSAGTAQNPHRTAWKLKNSNIVWFDLIKMSCCMRTLLLPAGLTPRTFLQEPHVNTYFTQRGLFFFLLSVFLSVFQKHKCKLIFHAFIKVFLCTQQHISRSEDKQSWF